MQLMSSYCLSLLWISFFLPSLNTSIVCCTSPPHRPGRSALRYFVTEVAPASLFKERRPFYCFTAAQAFCLKQEPQLFQSKNALPLHLLQRLQYWLHSTIFPGLEIVAILPLKPTSLSLRISWAYLAEWVWCGLPLLTCNEIFQVFYLLP